MLTTVPQQDAGDLNQPQIVGGLLLVAYQDGAALRQPAQRTLHYPSSSWITLLSLQVFLLRCVGYALGSRGAPPLPGPAVYRSPRPSTDVDEPPQWVRN